MDGADGLRDTKERFERDKAESFAKLHQLDKRIDDSEAEIKRLRLDKEKRMDRYYDLYK